LTRPLFAVLDLRGEEGVAYEDLWPLIKVSARREGEIQKGERRVLILPLIRPSLGFFLRSISLDVSFIFFIYSCLGSSSYLVAKEFLGRFRSVSLSSFRQTTFPTRFPLPSNLEDLILSVLKLRSSFFFLPLLYLKEEEKLTLLPVLPTERSTPLPTSLPGRLKISNADPENPSVSPTEQDLPARRKTSHPRRRRVDPLEPRSTSQLSPTKPSPPSSSTTTTPFDPLLLVLFSRRTSPCSSLRGILLLLGG